MTRCGLAALSLIVAAAPSALAQSAGSLRGTVADASGAVLPGATVTLTSGATRSTRSVPTDTRGGYYFASVERGAYTLRVELVGFRAWEATGLRVSANDTLGVDVRLEIGAVTDTVTVTADRAMLSNLSGAREGVITPETIESHSILGRNPLELLRILPGVVAPTQASFEVQGINSGFGGSGNTAFAINGSRPEQLGITLDGANLRDVGNNGGMLNVPNNEFVAEVKIQVSNYAAEFGSSAVNVQAVTRGGSSVLHGSAYWYNRHHALAANDRSRSLIGLERPESTFNYPGFTLSGPLLLPGFNQDRDQAFFFLGYEWARQRIDEGLSFSVVPTPGQREGLFTDYLDGQHLDQPTSVAIPFGFPGQGTPAPGNDLRPYMTPTGQAFLNLHPLPNYDDPANRYNWVYDAPSAQDRQQGVARLDFNLTDATKLYVRLARDTQVDEQDRGGVWVGFGAPATPTPLELRSVGLSAVVDLTSVLSPTTTNELLFSWSRLRHDAGWQDPWLMQKATYGIADSLNPLGDAGQIPELVNQYSGERGGLWYTQDADHLFAYNGFLRFADSFTKVRDTHALKAGLVVERQYKQQNSSNASNVRYVFAPWAAGSTGHDYGDMLVSRPASAEIGTPSAVGHFAAWSFEAYVQDSWKVRPNLTLEYGLRFGRWTDNVETGGLGAIFHAEDYDPEAGLFLDPDTRQRLNGFRYARTGQVEDALRGPRPLLWMPRLNFSWDVSGDGRTVVRGGAGIFYTREQGNAQYGTINLPPNAYRVFLDSYAYGGLGCGWGCSEGGLTYANIGSADPFDSLIAVTPQSLSPHDLAWPRTTNLSLSVSRRIPWRQTLEVGYVGAFGRHLLNGAQQNVVPIGTLREGLTVGNADMGDPLQRAALLGGVFDTLRPFPAYTGLYYTGHAGRTDFHSLQVTLSRPAGAFQYLIAYTLGRSFGTVAWDYYEVDPHDPRRTDGLLQSDRRHVVNASWTLRLGRPAAGGIGAPLLNDWNLSGISTFASGSPFRLGFSGDLGTDQMTRAWWGTQDFARYGLGAIAPVYHCDPQVGSSDVGEAVLDVGCLGIPAFGTEGRIPSPPHDIRSPGRSFHDLTIFKDFSLGGAKRLQLRIGVFNLFNQAYPDPYQGDVDIGLNTACDVRVNGVPNGVGTSDDVCDPRGGFAFTQTTLENFGRIVTKRGHRVIELALRLSF